MKRELGLSVNGPIENVFSSGLFGCIEYCIGANFDFEDAFEVWEAKTQEMKALCKKYNVRMHSYHLPFNGERTKGVYMHAPAALDSELRRKTLEQSKRLILGVADAGIKFVVIHGSLRVLPEERTQKVGYLSNTLRSFAIFVSPTALR